MRLKPEEIENLPETGEQGLLKEMFKDGGKWKSVYELTSGGEKRNWKQTKEYLRRLQQKHRVEEDYRVKKTLIVRPDAVSLDLTIALNLLEDVRSFAKEVRGRFRITCPKCGFTQRVFRWQAWRRFLPCPTCGYRPSQIEYPTLF